LKTKKTTSRTRPAQRRVEQKPAVQKQKTVTWLLVADGEQAQLYAITHGTFSLRPVSGGHFTQKNMSQRMSTSRKPQKRPDIGNKRRHAMELHRKGHDRREISFVLSLSEYIGVAAREKRFNRLIIAAPPKAMSELRSALPDSATAKVAVEITHEWAHLTLNDMSNRVKATLLAVAP
jgi:protein required for attachment to host cells